MLTCKPFPKVTSTSPHLLSFPTHILIHFHAILCMKWSRLNFPPWQNAARNIGKWEGEATIFYTLYGLCINRSVNLPQWWWWKYSRTLDNGGGEKSNIPVYIHMLLSSRALLSKSANSVLWNVYWAKGYKENQQVHTIFFVNNSDAMYDLNEFMAL